LKVSRESRLLLGGSVNGSVAGFIDADVKFIGVEELALLLARVRIVSSLENGSKSSGSTTIYGDVDA